MTSKETIGTLFNIQQFTIHDGPGLRTTLFLKGCPLHCPWCSNPESILPQPQVNLVRAGCRQCGACVDICPAKALSMDETLYPVLDITRCDQCMACVDGCPAGAIRSVGSRVTAAAAADLLLKDEPFYRNTGGGVTISGGEPLTQPSFTASVFGILKQQGIHTALDTTGFAPPTHLETIAPVTDLVLFDIKHLDPVRHRQVVGVSNETILDNLQWIARRCEVWLRVPLIPGFNDDVDLTDRISDLGKEIGATRVCFMPFHRWGEHKYASLGMGVKP